MTIKEIHSLLDIPTSTMSDWDKSVKRKKLVKLLKNIDVKTVKHLLTIEDTAPKYSEKTQKIKLDKKLFTKDILWAQEDGSEVSIKNLISSFFSIPYQEDTNKLIQLFGEKRVRNILKKNKPIMSDEDYKEIDEQIEYAISPNSYYTNHQIPNIDEVLHNPKQRYVDKLTSIFPEDQILDMAKTGNVSLSTLIQIKKFLTKAD